MADPTPPAAPATPAPTSAQVFDHLKTQLNKGVGIAPFDLSNHATNPNVAYVFDPDTNQRLATLTCNQTTCQVGVTFTGRTQEGERLSTRDNSERVKLKATLTEKLSQALGTEFDLKKIHNHNPEHISLSYKAFFGKVPPNTVVNNITPGRDLEKGPKGPAK